ncbi:MAG: hypothetical protein V4641_05845, partial [Pseudomonadota bacterium]
TFDGVRAALLAVWPVAANRIEADESAVPVAMVVNREGGQELFEERAIEYTDAIQKLPHNTPLFTHPPAQPAQEQPIPMILHCPSCGLQHIDAPETHHLDRALDEASLDGSYSASWDNPPHRSHLCHGCGTVWRPADVATTGVSSIETKGKADTMKAAQEQPGWKWVPVEPTQAMIDKGTDEHQCEQGDPYYSAPLLSEGDAIAIYKAMIAASPSAPEGGEVKA